MHLRRQPYPNWLTLYNQSWFNLEGVQIVTLHRGHDGSLIIDVWTENQQQKLKNVIWLGDIKIHCKIPIPWQTGPLISLGVIKKYSFEWV